MLDFAMAVCRSDSITEQHFQSLEEVGFDREDAWDIAAIAAFFAMSNRLAHLTDMRPNLEFYNMGRVPRDKSKDKWKSSRKMIRGQRPYVTLQLKVCWFCLFFFLPLMWTVSQMFTRSSGMQPKSNLNWTLTLEFVCPEIII